MRVAIDQQVLGAAKDGVRSVVIRPTLIYGRGIGVSSTSVQLPKLIDVARKAAVPRHVGRGLNIWGNVHIADVVDLYLLALEKAPRALSTTPRTAKLRSRRSRNRSAGCSALATEHRTGRSEKPSKASGRAPI